MYQMSDFNDAGNQFSTTDNLCPQTSTKCSLKTWKKPEDEVVPSQLLWFGDSVYPSPQLHIKLPMVLVHVCSQPPLFPSAHSTMSAERERDSVSNVISFNELLLTKSATISSVPRITCALLGSGTHSIVAVGNTDCYEKKHYYPVPQHK